MLSSRLGLETSAVEVGDDLDFWDVVVERLTAGGRVDYVICDEAQFYTPRQVEQLARLVDELGIAVTAFGITADFRTELFPGSRRFIELADRVEVLQVEALCWCGRRATHNARIVDGVMVVEGAQVVVGDTAAASEGLVEYEVLCRPPHAADEQPRGPAGVAHARTRSPSTSTPARSRPPPDDTPSAPRASTSGSPRNVHETPDRERVLFHLDSR